MSISIPGRRPVQTYTILHQNLGNYGSGIQSRHSLGIVGQNWTHLGRSRLGLRQPGSLMAEPGIRNSATGYLSCNYTGLLMVKECRVPAAHCQWDSAERLIHWDSRMSRQCGNRIVVVMRLVLAALEDLKVVPSNYSRLSSVARSNLKSSTPSGLQDLLWCWPQRSQSLPANGDPRDHPWSTSLNF
jgi:hypothetical protein